VIPLVAVVSICAVLGLFAVLLFVVASAPKEEAATWTGDAVQRDPRPDDIIGTH
jgi:hypothetical protein